MDASVLAAVVFEEPRTQEANALIRGVELHAPALLAYEMTHIAQKKYDQGGTQRRVLKQALEAALSMHIRWVEVDHGAVVRGSYPPQGSRRCLKS